MKRDFSDANVARRIAQLLVTHAFDSRKVASLWRPDAKHPGPLGARMMAEPAVQMEISKIMNRTERNADKFLETMWKWLEQESAGPLDKDTGENRRTAARILAKGYISEKKGPDTSAGKALVIDASAKELGNLLDAPTDGKKLM